MSSNIVQIYKMFGIRLSEREFNFLSGLRRGMPPAAAAAQAGYKSPATVAPALMRREHVANVVAHLQAEFARDVSVSRADVLAKLEEAYDLARSVEKPGDMVRVASEINKMMGYYAPDKKQIVDDRSASGKQHMDAFDVAQMDDRELIEVASDG